MIISEKKLRSIIRQEIIKEAFLSSKVKSLEKVKLGDLTLQAIGYISPNDDGKFDHVLVYSKKTDHQKIVKNTGQKHPFKLLTNNFTYTIMNNERKYTHRVQLKSDMSAYAIPLTTPKLEKIQVSLKTGEASAAEYAIEIGGILGGLPLLGTPADLAAGVIAAIKDPPDYIESAFCFLCAIPAIGLGVAFARKAFKEASKDGVKGVTKAIREELADRGITLDMTSFSKVKQEFAEFINGITSEQRVRLLARVTEGDADIISDHLGEVKKYMDEMIDNLVIVGKASEGVDDLTKAIVKRTSAKLIREITEGQIRNVCVRWAGDLAKQLPKKFPSGDVQDMIGHVFKHPETGKDIVFNSFQEFKSEFKNMTQLAGIPNADELFDRHYTDMLAGKIEAVNIQNIEAITDTLMQKMSKIKIKMIVDPKTAAKEFSPGERGLMYPTDPPIILMNYVKFAKDGLEKNIQETMEHELIHGIDKLLLTVLAGGNELAEDLIKSKGLRLASDIATTTGVLKGADGSKLADYVFSEEGIQAIIDSGSRSLAGLTNWQYYLAKSYRSSNIADLLAYISDPAEMFVRVQRVSYWLKGNGFKPNEWDQFFRRDAKIMISEVPDADFFKPFFKLFDELYSGNASDFEKQVVDDLYAMFDALI